MSPERNEYKAVWKKRKNKEHAVLSIAGPAGISGLYAALEEAEKKGVITQRDKKYARYVINGTKALLNNLFTDGGVVTSWEGLMVTGIQEALNAYPAFADQLRKEIITVLSLKRAQEIFDIDISDKYKSKKLNSSASKVYIINSNAVDSVIPNTPTYYYVVSNNGTIEQPQLKRFPLSNIIESLAHQIKDNFPHLQVAPLTIVSQSMWDITQSSRQQRQDL